MSITAAKSQKRKSRLLKIVLWTVSVFAFFVIGIYIAFQVSPWPAVLIIRRSFHKEGSAANERLVRYVPQGIRSRINIQYDGSHGMAKLDLYCPAHSMDTKYPLIIWVHGGGFVAGDKSEMANYCKILASRGFAVAAANYSRAPAAKYPVPVSQINAAMAFLVNNAGTFNIDTSCVILAGDSGGAHIAAQLANIFTSAEYSDMLGIAPSVDAKNLKGAILYCGPYNAALVNFEDGYGWFLRTVLWSYSGTKNFKDDPALESFSVSNFVTEKFPATFISVGNEDPLRFHSYELASKLSSKGVRVDSLFFPDNYSPGLPHEYQLNLNSEAGKLALEKTFNFLQRLSAGTTLATSSRRIKQ